MKKWFVLAVGFFVISVGLIFAGEAKAPAVAFTLAISPSAVTNSSTGISFRLMCPSGENASLEVLENVQWPWCTTLGYQALFSNVPNFTYHHGEENTALGYNAMFSNTIGISNTAAGYRALYSNTWGGGNAAFGSNALNHSTGSGDTGIGCSALSLNTEGGYNTGLGYSALGTNTTGHFNTAVGHDAYDSNDIGGNFNILLGAQVQGKGDTNTMRLGLPFKVPGFLGIPEGQNQTFIAGIVEHSFTPAENELPAVVGVLSTGQLGTIPPELLPAGPPGPQGIRGEPGVPGQGLISGSLLLLPAGYSPPPGYALVGSSTFNVSPEGETRTVRFVIYIFQKL